MNAGVTVLICIVGALALCEAVLPRVFAVLRRWRLDRAKKAREAAAETIWDVGPDGPQPVSDEDSLDDDCYCGRLGTCGAPMAGRCPPDGAAAVAQQLWDEARAMKHWFNPDWILDHDYLAKVYAAARLGHIEAMAKLGDYAYRRGAIVEAFYWTALAELKGADWLEEALFEMRTRWLMEWCPEEYENVYADFTEEHGVFARAVLRLQCDVDPQYACARLKELEERGVEEARLFLEERIGPGAGDYET